MSAPAASATTRKSRYEVALDCVHCGLCLPVCPTYLELGNEADSPRGRIYLMRAHEENRQALTPAFREHLDLCLVCRACETACPSGVRFGSMMEEFRALMRAHESAAPQHSGRDLRRRWSASLGRYLLLRVLPDARRLGRVATLLRFLQQTGVVTAARRTGLLRLLDLEAAAAQSPTIPGRARRRAWPEVLLPHGKRRARVVFLRGCVAPEVLPEVQYASIEALRHNGCEVVTPGTQTCCGALHFHSGFRDAGLDLLTRNVAALDVEGSDAIVANAAGCGATLKEYGALGQERPQVAGAAARVASRVRDISEFLVELGLEPPQRPVRVRVAYDEPCHLLHGQGVSAAPKQVLDAIPGLERVVLRDADRCCGSAGIYNLLHARLAADILEDKIEAIAESQAGVIATGNPGCILQIRAGLARAATARPALGRVRVLHPMQLLAQSYQLEGPDSGCVD